MVKEFWSELLTKESWAMLTSLAREYDFILIGGWSVYLWAGMHKSKDIDIVVDYGTLKLLSGRFNLGKNPRLAKYELRFDKFDVDIYLPFFSKLAIPPEALAGYIAKVQGITTVQPEALLVLKQAAEIERRGTPKGRKDAIDLMTLLIHSEVDLTKYHDLLIKYKHESFANELATVIKTFGDSDIDYLGLGFVEFKKWKKGILGKLAGA
ncbi:hypothetical protein AUJ13_01640 [Candidatus Micrarchaeota archaeon CG1_02_49_24]|nr:MAG: hypothetical protein AUJ13_01640 [Candidatus Micrarchaeota archaeon CG1_02_49_24]PIU82517.1 MAG: hypothetical protein COS70_00895 [Candidatus Micrarchaeota archaeon CG06_land_8_20_14_3_00_50_6]HII54419.1 hypothetical protein [Candidatus Micrarchaeota archaeon]